MMLTCFACNTSVATQAECPRCGADLQLLQSLRQVPNVWFNRAIDELEEGSYWHALEWLSACCAADPNDVEARLALAETWAQLGHMVPAREALLVAEELAPQHERLAEAVQFVETRAVLRRATPGRSSRFRLGRPARGRYRKAAQYG